jgi:hypothetical protein
LILKINTFFQLFLYLRDFLRFAQFWEQIEYKFWSFYLLIFFGECGIMEIRLATLVSEPLYYAKVLNY